MKAIDVAIDLGYTPLKLNCVVMRGVNDSEVIAFRSVSGNKPPGSDAPLYREHAFL